MSHKKNIRILGIDPGTAIVGWSVLETTSDKPTIIAYGDITTDKDLSDEKRLDEIALDIEHIIRAHKPSVAAIESLFFFKNQKTIITVAQARGVILHTCSRNDLEIHSYTPLQIKQALTGYGRATKTQIQSMIVKVLGLKEVPKPDDTADALAVALCHNNSMNAKKRIEKAKS